MRQSELIPWARWWSPSLPVGRSAGSDPCPFNSGGEASSGEATGGDTTGGEAGGEVETGGTKADVPDGGADRQGPLVGGQSGQGLLGDTRQAVAGALVQVLPKT